MCSFTSVKVHACNYHISNQEINIFEGQFNRITFEQVYTKTFKCTYQLQLYPFDTQVHN